MVARTLGGPSPLEARWREVLELVEAAGTKRSVSVARCYPALNRVPDVLPFDQTRVELKSGKDDYINASRLDSPEGLGPGAVVTQAPLARSMADFWALVWQEAVEVMVCLVPDHDLGDSVYLPAEKERLEAGPFSLVTYSSKHQAGYTERLVNITHSQTKTTRAVIHLQMQGWPGPDLPHSPACLLDTAAAVLSLKSRSRLLVHCVEGSSKSGTFLAVLWLLASMESMSGPSVPPSPSWPPVTPILAHIMLQRKGVVRDKQFLKLVYDALLYYCQDVLMKQGILNTGPKSQAGKSHSRHPSLDFVVPALALSAVVDKTAPPVPGPAAVTEQVPPAVDAGAAGPPGAGPLEAGSPGAAPPVAGAVVEVPASPTPPSGPAVKNIPDDLTKLADLSVMGSPKQRKITKEDFLTQENRIVNKEENPSDPLAQLDPLWSLK